MEEGLPGKRGKRKIEALNLKFEIRNEESEPRMNANGREMGRGREARAEAQRHGGVGAICYLLEVIGVR